MKRAAIGLSLFALIACGGGSDSEVSLEEFCATDGPFVELFDKVLECDIDISVAFPNGIDPADLSAVCNGGIGAYVDDGSTLLGNQGSIDACLAAIRDTPCLDFDIDQLTACDEVVIGTIPIDGVCEEQDQCVDGAYCLVETDGMCGTCAAQAENGMACDEDEECTSRNCVDGTCADFGATGAACADDDDCLGLRECDAGTGLCREPRVWAVGDSCSNFGECGLASGLYCNQQTMECVEFLAIGDTCSPMSLALCNLVLYEFCDSDSGVCTAPTTVALGADCSVFTGEKCQDGLVCSSAFEFGTPGECFQPRQEGQQCSDQVATTTCDIFLECLEGTCAYSDYTGMCPAQVDSGS